MYNSEMSNQTLIIVVILCASLIVGLPMAILAYGSAWCFSSKVPHCETEWVPTVSDFAERITTIGENQYFERLKITCKCVNRSEDAQLE